MIERFFLLVLLVMSFIPTSFAQPGGGGDPGAGQPVPIQGLLFLLIAGAFLGIKKLVSGNKTNKNL